MTLSPTLSFIAIIIIISQQYNTIDYYDYDYDDHTTTALI